MQSSENENSNNEFTNSAFRGEEQEDADLTELTETSEPEAGSSQGKSIGTFTLLILSNENLDAIDDLLLSSFFFENLSEETTEQEKDSASAPKEEEASTSQDKTENTGIVYKPD